MYRNGRHRRDAVRTKDLRLRATCACDGIEEGSEHSKGPEVKCSPRKPIVLEAKSIAPARATNVEAATIKIENPLRRVEG